MIRTQRTSAARCRSENPCVSRSTRGVLATSWRSAGNMLSDRRGASCSANGAGGSSPATTRMKRSEKFALLVRRQSWLILDGVCDAAQQIRVADDIAQARWKLRNGKRERARDILQDRVLPRQIGGMFVSRHG